MSGQAARPSGRKTPFVKMRLLPLIGATYFMVSGGPYGLEDIIGKAGYGRAILILLLVPFFWSLPTSLMIGELATAIPAEGGFYQWVRRAMGPFWGFQEAWLSLAASVFDMAIYPTTFVLYLSHLAPAMTAGYRGWLLKLLIVAISAVWNLRGSFGGRGGVGADDGDFALTVCRADWACGLEQRSCGRFASGECGSAFDGGSFGGFAGCALELHGMGQCEHDRAGG